MLDHQNNSIEPCGDLSWIDEWNQKEMDLQCAALGWFLLWRKDNKCELFKTHMVFEKQVKDNVLYSAMEPRMVEWAWLERGGLDLERTHRYMLKRHIENISKPIQKEIKNVEFKQSVINRKPGKRPRIKNDSERETYLPLFASNYRDMEG